MLDSVGHTPMQNFGRPETTFVAQEKKALIEKEQKEKENRPVESAQEGAEAKKKAAAEEEKVREERPIKPPQEKAEVEKKDEENTSGYTFEENRVIYEKYNNSGDVILRLPPAKKPVDERV